MDVRRALALLAMVPVLPLGHAGRWLTDATGRVVVSHGINMVYKKAPYRPDAIGFGADDARFLAREGYDSVRLGVIYAAVEPKPGQYDDAYMKRIEKTVDLLGKHGITSLLDFHQDLYNERFQGEGWPDWAVQDDGLPAEPKNGFPANYLAMPALQRAFDNFFGNSGGLVDHYAAAWRHVAQRFARNPHVMGYDLLNEPWPGTEWQECANPQGCPTKDAQLAAFTKATIGAIRKADRTHLVFYEPYVLFDFGAGTTIGPFGDKHLAMSFHDYCLSAGSSDSNEGCDQVTDLPFQNADAQSERTGDAALLTEFGATTNEDILTSMLAKANRFLMGWQEWHYCGCDDPTTTGSGDKQAIVFDPRKPPTGKNLDAKKLALLSEPHAVAVAGTPTSMSYDASTHAYALKWTPARASGKGAFPKGSITEVLVPHRQYPKGYRAKVTGGKVVSKRGALRLRIRAGGAKALALAVSPRS